MIKPHIDRDTISVPIEKKIFDLKDFYLSVFKFEKSAISI